MRLYEDTRLVVVTDAEEPADPAPQVVCSLGLHTADTVELGALP